MKHTVVYCHKLWLLSELLQTAQSIPGVTPVLCHSSDLQQTVYDIVLAHFQAEKIQFVYYQSASITYLSIIYAHEMTEQYILLVKQLQGFTYSN